MDVDLILALVIIGGVITMFAIAVVRMGWFGGRRNPVSSGVATWLGEIDHMLNPSRPAVEDIAKARDDTEEAREDDGDPPEP